MHTAKETRGQERWGEVRQGGGGGREIEGAGERRGGNSIKTGGVCIFLVAVLANGR